MGNNSRRHETIEVKKTENGKQRFVKDCSIKPDDLSIGCYKKFLLSKLKDTLEIAGINLLELDHNIIKLQGTKSLSS